MTKRKQRLRALAHTTSRLARLLFKSRVLLVFLGLTALGAVVGFEARPRADRLPWDELFAGLGVVSHRDAPADTAARFVVQLAAGGRVFAQYDVDARTFVPPPRGREYRHAISGTRYRPLRLRGHVASGFWLDAPGSRRALLPEQFAELYRSTLDFVKPVSVLSGVLGIASGYSVGYRIGTWNGSLASRAVQERVLATPGLGPGLAREAWRRVLLEPAVLADENDATRVASVAETQRLYARFVQVALADSDGFVPREAARLAAAGREVEARAMLAFAAAVRRAADSTVHLASADFEAVERWASILDRRGHWAHGSLPPAGEERVRLLGTWAWYGLAPPVPGQRVWIGPRLLVRDGEAEGFIADDLPATGVGCPVAWSDRLDDPHTGLVAAARAWLSDRPEFVALAALGERGTAGARRLLASWRAAPRPALRPAARPGTARPAAFEPGAALPAAWTFALAIPGRDARLVVATADSAVARAARALAEAVLARELAAAALAPGADPAAAAPLAARLGLGDVAVDSAGAVTASFIGLRLALAVFAESAALDRAADSLRAAGVGSALIGLEGLAVALGDSAGTPWRLRLGGDAALQLDLEPGDAAAVARDSSAAGTRTVAVLAPGALAARAWSRELARLPAAEARRRAAEREEISVVLAETLADGTVRVWVESDLAEQVRAGDTRLERF